MRFTGMESLQVWCNCNMLCRMNAKQSSAMLTKQPEIQTNKKHKSSQLDTGAELPQITRSINYCPVF